MPRTLTIETAPVFAPLYQPARYKGSKGGRGAAKSHDRAGALVELCLMQETRALCLREVQLSLRQSVKKLIEDKIKAFGVQREFRVLNTHIEGPHDSEIHFQGMQNQTAESLKSFEGFDLAWVEEAQTISKRSLTLLRPTIRKPHSELWFTWNPRFSTDPIDDLLNRDDRPPHSVVVHSTYRDNPWFPKVLQDEVDYDRRRDIDLYTHVWEGGYETRNEARVFKNWRIEAFDTPHNAEFLLGADWGFSVDPTTAGRCFIVGRTLYVDDEVYQIGCEIDDTPALFDRLGCEDCTPTVDCGGTGKGHGSAREWIMIADSARPETISYMQRHDYPRIVPARKGPGSVEEGIKFLQSYDIVVHPRCVHTIDELTHYSYKKHPLTDAIMPILSDKKNHVIDRLRYAIEGVNRAVLTDSNELLTIMRTAAKPAHQIVDPVVLNAPPTSRGVTPPPFNMGSINSLFGKR